MAILVTPIEEHKRFLVKFMVEREDEENYYFNHVTTEVFIPNGRPMIELLAQTIFKCLNYWAGYDPIMKGASVTILHYKRLENETVVGFVDIIRRGKTIPKRSVIDEI